MEGTKVFCEADELEKRMEKMRGSKVLKILTWRRLVNKSTRRKVKEIVSNFIRRHNLEIE